MTTAGQNDLAKAIWVQRLLPAVYCDWMVAGLLLLLLHCSYYIDHAFTVSGDAHFWPSVEMKLTHCSRFVLLQEWKESEEKKKKDYLQSIRLLVGIDGVVLPQLVNY